MIRLLFVSRLFKKIIDPHPPNPSRGDAPFPGRGRSKRGGEARTKPVVSVSRRVGHERVRRVVFSNILLWEPA